MLVPEGNPNHISCYKANKMTSRPVSKEIHEALGKVLRTALQVYPGDFGHAGLADGASCREPSLNVDQPSPAIRLACEAIA